MGDGGGSIEIRMILSLVQAFTKLSRTPDRFSWCGNYITFLSRFYCKLTIRKVLPTAIRKFIAAHHFRSARLKRECHFTNSIKMFSEREKFRCKLKQCTVTRAVKWISHTKHNYNGIFCTKWRTKDRKNLLVCTATIIFHRSFRSLALISAKTKGAKMSEPKDMRCIAEIIFAEIKIKFVFLH